MANEFIARKGLLALDNSSVSGSFTVDKSGSTVFDVIGSAGQLFSIEDGLSGSLFAVSDISGLPIFEVFSDNTIIAGEYNQNDFIIKDNKVGIGTDTLDATLTLSGSYLQNGADDNSGKADFAVKVSDNPAISLRNEQVQIGGDDMNYVARWDIDTSDTTLRAWERDIKIMTQGNAGGRHIKFSTTGSERMRITKTGNVGIGTSSPGSRLDVVGNTHIRSGSLILSHSSAGQIGTIFEQPTQDLHTMRFDSKKFRIWAGGSGRLTILSSSGNVGIGTENPLDLLNVVGGKIRVDRDDFPQLTLRRSDTDVYAEIGVAGGEFFFKRGDDTNSFRFRRSDNTDVMSIDMANQEVGINTVSPDAALHVIPANGLNTVAIFESTDDKAFIRIKDEDTDAHLISKDSKFYIGSTSADYSRFNVELDDSGRVGIGTQTPTYTLDVQSGSAGVLAPNSIIRAKGTTIGRLSLQNDTRHYSISTQGSALYFYDESAPGTRMLLDSNGNLGIGTTSPNSKLDVRRGSDGIALELHSTVGDADEFVDFKMIAGNTTAGTLGTIFRHQRQGTGGGDMIIFTNDNLSATPTETIRFTSDQKVGIGTTSPGEKLEVAGNISASGVLFASLSLDDSNHKTVVYDTLTGKLHYTGSYGGGGGSNFTLTADSGTDQTIDGTSTLDIAGGTNINTSVGNTDTVTVNLDNNIAVTNITASAISSSGDLIGDTITGNNLNISQSITADTLTLLGISLIDNNAAVISGSNIFGNEITNKHEFTGSVEITGSLKTVGNGTFSSQVGVGTYSPFTGTKLHVTARDTSPNLSAETPSDVTAIFSNSDTQYGTIFATEGSGKGFIQQRRTNSATYYDLALQPHGGRVGIGLGTSGTSAPLHVSGNILIKSGNIQGTRADTLVKAILADLDYEDIPFYNHETLNAFAGAHLWADITASNVSASNGNPLATDSITEFPFIPGGNTYQPYFNPDGSEIVIEIDHTNEPLRYASKVGIQFTHKNWRANRVKIEAYSGSGEWVTGVDTTTNDEALVASYFQLGSSGIQKVKFTLGDPQSSNNYLRISKIFGYDYKGVSSGQNDAIATGTYYLDKFEDSAHYSIIYPASGNVDLGKNTNKYRKVYADDLVLDNFASVSTTLTNLEAAGGSDNLGNHTATEDLKMATFNIDNVGKIGIGTATPSEALELSAGKKIKLQSGTNSTGSMIFRTSDLQTLFSSFNTSAGDDQQFVLKHNYGNTELINRRGDLILSASTGRIGIGTDDPVANQGLHINGDNTPRLLITAVDNGSPAITSHIELRGYDGRGKGVYLTESGSLSNKEIFFGAPYSGQNEVFSIGYNGEGNGQSEYLTSSSLYLNLESNKLGLGTTAPERMLHVSGSDVNTKIILERSTNDARIETRTRGAGAYFLADSRGSANYYGLELLHNTTGKWFIGSYGNSNFQIIDGPKSTGTAHLTVQDSTGDVGIGTTSPSAKLHVSQSTSDPGLLVDGGTGGNLVAKFRRTEGVSNALQTDINLGIHFADSDSQITFEPATETNLWSIGADNNDGGNFIFAPAVKIKDNEVAHINREGGVYAASITASGEISSSGGLYANLETADNTNASNVVVVDTATGEFYYTGSYGVGGGTSVLGSDTQVVFFDGDNNPVGDAGFTYNKTTNSITSITDITSSGIIHASGSGTHVQSRIYRGDSTQDSYDSNTYINISGERLTFRSNGTQVLAIDTETGDARKVIINPLSSSEADASDFIINGADKLDLFKIDGSENSIAISRKGSGSYTDFVNTNNGGTYSPPSIIAPLENVTIPNQTINVAPTQNFTVTLPAPFNNFTGTVKLTKVELQMEAPGLSARISNLNIGGTDILRFVGNYETNGAYEEAYNSTTPTVNPGNWGVWTLADDFVEDDNVTVNNGVVDVSLSRTNYIEGNIGFRFTIEGVANSTIGNDGSHGKGLFLVGDLAEDAALTQNNEYAAHLVNIDKRDSDLGYAASGLKITLGKPFGKPIDSAGDQYSNWFLKCEGTDNNNQLRGLGGITTNPIGGTGIELFGLDFSDRRLKENIKASKDGLNIVNQLKVKEFNFIGTDVKQRGLIAQDVKKVIPEAVVKGLDFYELRWNKITPYLIKAMQQQQAQIEKLQKEIDKLKKNK